MDLDNTQHCLSIITEMVRDLLRLSNIMNVDPDNTQHYQSSLRWPDLLRLSNVTLWTWTTHNTVYQSSLR